MHAKREQQATYPPCVTRHTTTPGLYADAFVYDILHDSGSGKESLAEAKLLVNIARAAGAGCPRTARGMPALSCYEPACGSGRVLVALAKLGHNAVGSDIDPHMVDYANTRLRELGLHVAGASTRDGTLRSVHRATTKVRNPVMATRGAGRGHAIVCAMDALPTGHDANALLPGSIDLAINPINSIRHLASDAAMLRHLRIVKSLLADNGVYVVGLSMSMVGSEHDSEDIWKGSRKGVHVTQVVQYIPPTGTERGAAARREHVLSHLTISRKGRADEHRDSAYWLRTYSKSQWLSLVQRAGLVVKSTHSTDGVAMPARELGYYWFALGSNNGR